MCGRLLTWCGALQAWEVHALLAAGIASGEVVPLPLNRFARKEAGNAFRFMAAGAGLSHAWKDMQQDLFSGADVPGFRAGLMLR